MTREQAIKILKEIEIPTNGDNEKERNIAFDMAIKTLVEQEPTTKNDLGVDCISRTQTQTEIEMSASRYTIAKERGGMGQVEWSDQLIKVSDAVDIIRHLPSVTPQEPKTGHWIEVTNGRGGHECDVCHDYAPSFQNGDEYLSAFCPNCGADMREVKE